MSDTSSPTTQDGSPNDRNIASPNDRNIASPNDRNIASPNDGNIASPDIAAAVRTVVDLARVFRELKTAAAHLEDTISAVDRGYFTPTEEEQVQRLVVTYSQARRALFDLIQERRDYASRPDHEANDAFLIAFAGVVVLVDAAITLRELVDRRPVVRRQLNHPIPSFQIPGGFYDTIQRSLVSSRHAWHLYHAIHYWEQNRESLFAHASNRQMDEVCGIIEQLVYRLMVSKRQYVHARWRTRSDQLLRAVGRTMVMRAVYGIQKLVAGSMADVYVRPSHQPRLPVDVVRQLARLVQPGDVFVVRKEYALTNYFLPGYWPHAALYLGTPRELEALRLHQSEHGPARWPRILAASQCPDSNSDDEPVVLESMKDGVFFRSWNSPLGADSIVVLRPTIDPETLASALSRVIKHEGKSYDFDFDFTRSDRLVCTEVVYRAYDGIGHLRFALTHRVGRPTLSGGDLVQLGIDGTLFQPVLVYASKFAQGVVQNHEAKKVMTKGLAAANGESS